MPDWEKIIREKLGTLPLTNGRRNEVIEELAQQLESAYEEALAQGITEQEALRRSLAQFKDWEKLRMELFQSVEGARLPIWEQNGFVAPRRLPVWIALALTLLLLARPPFRQALAILPVPGNDPIAWAPRIFPESALRRMEQSGDKQKYARSLAFVALHSPKEDELRALHAAEKAMALDPQLTWISAKISHATYSFPGYDPQPWIERLKVWDPQNGFPYLLEADAMVHWWEPSRTSSVTKRGLRPDLVAEPRWRIPMEKAFAAPRMDFYSVQQFALDRQVLEEQGFDRPDILIVGMWSQPMPDLVAMNFYVDSLLKDIGENSEKSGRLDVALASYESIAHFGESLESGSVYNWQLRAATKYRKEAYEKMIPLLRSQGHTEQAAQLQTTLASLSETGMKRPSFLPNVVGERSARVVQLSAVFVILLFAATAAWLMALSVLRWKPNLGFGLNRLASVLCAAPVLLLLSSLALFVGYYPYSRPIAQYASIQELQQSFGPFFMSVYGLPGFGEFMEVYLPQMFWPTVWCAAVALVGGGLLLWLRNRTRQENPNAI